MGCLLCARAKEGRQASPGQEGIQTGPNPKKRISFALWRQLTKGTPRRPQISSRISRNSCQGQPVTGPANNNLSRSRTRNGQDFQKLSLVQAWLEPGKAGANSKAKVRRNIMATCEPCPAWRALTARARPPRTACRPGAPARGGGASHMPPPHRADVAPSNAARAHARTNFARPATS